MPKTDVSEKQVNDHARRLRHAMNTFVVATQEDASKERLFSMMRSALNGILKSVEKYTEVMHEKDLARVQLSNVIIAAVLEVMEHNPMYDSRALSLQLDSAIDKVIEDYKKQMLNPEQRRG